MADFHEGRVYKITKLNLLHTTILYIIRDCKDINVIITIISDEKLICKANLGPNLILMNRPCCSSYFYPMASFSCGHFCMASKVTAQRVDV